MKYLFIWLGRLICFLFYGWLSALYDWALVAGDHAWCIFWHAGHDWHVGAWSMPPAKFRQAMLCKRCLKIKHVEVKL